MRAARQLLTLAPRLKADIEGFVAQLSPKLRVTSRFSLGDHRLGGDQQVCGRRRVLDRRAHDLGWVNDTGLDQIAILTGLGIVGLARPRLTNEPGVASAGRAPSEAKAPFIGPECSVARDYRGFEFLASA
jgi:hypothetical protein